MEGHHLSDIKTTWLNLKITQGEGLRVDKALALSTEDYSRSQITKWFNEGRVYHLAKRLKASEKLPLDTEVNIEIDCIEADELRPEAIALDIRYEDEYLLVVNKPQGMVVHPGAGHISATLVSALMFRYGSNLSSEGGIERPGIVHRIDKDTSGLLMVVKNNLVHHKISDRLRRHEITREYQALVHGHVQDQSGTIIAPIARDKHNRQRQAVRADGKEAITHFELKEHLKGSSHLVLQLETGRTHQIRVHMHYIGHPVIGDPIYAGKRERYGLVGQALHASRLRFEHPITGEEIEVTAELPDYFQAYLQENRK